MGQELQPVHHFSHWVQEKFHKEVLVEKMTQVQMDNSGAENDLVLPVLYNGLWLSQVRIKNGQFLDRFSQHQISHFVDLQLAPALYKQALDLQIGNLLSVARQEFQSEGLALFGGESESVENYFEELKRPPFSENYREPFVLCLHGKDTFRHRKIANEVHQMFSHRWALMNFRDLATEITHIDQIFELGAVTLFVDQVQNLELREIDLLNQFLLKKYSDFQPRQSTPLFILSSESAEDFKATLNSLSQEINEEHIFRTENWPLKSDQIRDILDLLLS